MQTFQRSDIAAPNAPPVVRGGGGALLYLEWNFTSSLSYDNWFSPTWNLGSLLGQLKFRFGPSI